MAFKFSIPFYAFRLHLHGGGSILVPMGKESALRMGQALHKVAAQYAEALQSQVLNRGELNELLNEYQAGDFIPSSLEVSFPQDSDGIRYPAFSVVFPFFYNEQKDGFWGLLPTLQLEAYAEDIEGLAQRLEEAVKLDFKRHRRLQVVQDILAAIWFEQVEMKQKVVKLEAPSPKELEHMMKNQHIELLPKVAQRLDIKRRESYGRSAELSHFAKALKSNFHRNVLLIGPSGVGKTALVWELARQQKKRRIDAQIWETSASVLIKELMKETGWQENLSLLCKEISNSTNLLFVRNLMDLFEVGKSEGNSVSMAEYLRPFLSNGELALISECTADELAQIEIKSPSFLNLFHRITLEEPREPQLSEIILNKVKDTAAIQQLQITDEAIKEAIRLNRRFMPYSGMPGQPIRFLESLLLRRQVEARKGGAGLHINKQDVLAQFCEETGMPQFIIDPALRMDASAIKEQFNNQVYGQERAVEQVVGILSKVKAALSKPETPIASFLFVGPTGVGKTELAKVLAGFMFGRRDKITRFDMSEFSTPYDVQRLIGGSYSFDGLLTSAIRKEPFSVLLFDEIEKADSSFYDLLLQLLSEGRLTDNQGKLSNFCSTIIIMTSNIGARNLSGPIGWQQGQNKSAVQDHFMAEVQKYFRPELFNRIDQVIPFAPLDPITIRFVVEREIELLRKREGIRFRRMSLRIEEAVLDYLGERGYDNKYGARQLQRTIREYLIVPLARTLSSLDIDDQVDIEIVLEDGQIDIKATADPLGLELLLEEYSKINHADHASSLRRRIEQLTEGHFYIQLLNELDLMERKKHSSKLQFWKDQKQAEKYAYYLNARQKTEQLLGDVGNLEIQLGLSCVDAGQYNPKWAEGLEQAEATFFELKTELYRRLNPKADHCHLGIYGPEPQFVLDFYSDLLRAREYEFQGYSIWYRETYYNEEVPLVSEEQVERRPRKKYYKRTYRPYQEAALQPEKEGDILWGIELSVTGSCAYLYLQEEEGIQQWIMDDEDYFYRIKIANDSFATPEKIHRKDFYLQSPPRRVLDEGFVKDISYKMSREYNKTELVNLIMEQLENRFRQKINQETI